MNCNQARTLLAPWLDDELDSRATTEIESHLSACSRCQERFAAEERVERLIGERLTAERMPEDVWERLQARIGQRRVLRWSWVAAAAAALLVVALSVIWSTRPEPPELIRRLVAAHREYSEDFLPGAQQATVMASITSFLGARATDWSPPLPGVHEGHGVEWVGAEAVSLGGHDTLSVRMTCCGEAMSIFVMDVASMADLPVDLAATLDKGITVRSSLDGVTAKTFLDGGVLISIVSEHATPVDGRSSG